MSGSGLKNEGAAAGRAIPPLVQDGTMSNDRIKQARGPIGRAGARITVPACF